MLSQLPLLRQLTLKGCPVAELPGYQEKILQLAPQLQILDNKRLEGARRNKRKAKEEAGGLMTSWQPLTSVPAAAAGSRGTEDGREHAANRAGAEDASYRQERKGFQGEELRESKKKKQKKENEKRGGRATGANTTKIAPPPAAITKTVAKPITNDDEDDDVLDYSALLGAPKGSSSKGRKSDDGGGSGRVATSTKLDPKRTGVVKVDVAASKDKKHQKKAKKKETEKEKVKSKARGAAALQAVLSAPGAVSSHGGGGDVALPGWD